MTDFFSVGVLIELEKSQIVDHNGLIHFFQEPAGSANIFDNEYRNSRDDLCQIRWQNPLNGGIAQGCRYQIKLSHAKNLLKNSQKMR